MFGKPIGKEERAPEDVVALKSLFGLRPGVYLAILYAAVLLAVLLAILLLPGILRPGSLVAFDSEPGGAAVRVDGVYVGRTPCSVFVDAGSRSIAFAAPGFAEVTVRKEVGSRLFASLFVPRRDSERATLRSDDPVAALAMGAADYAAWTFAGAPTATYQVPLALSEAAYRSAPGAAEAAVRSRMEDILRAASRFAQYDASQRDLLRAAFLVESAGLAPSPLSALGTGRAVLEYLSRTRGASAWLASSLGSPAASAVAGSQWYAAENARASALVAASRARAEKKSDRRVILASLAFREVPSGSLTPTGSFPRTIAVDSFYVAEKEIDEAAWEAFLAAKPEWRPDNKAELMKKGFVAASYLEKSDDPSYPAPSASGMSWYAAEAFCSWLSSSLPPALSGYEVRLPTEAEWERAARAAPIGVERLIGGLWEWCGDLYAPLDFLPAPKEAVTAVSSPERSVRGGSWANPGTSITVDTRASLPGNSCSPFVGFRPVIARKSAE